MKGAPIKTDALGNPIVQGARYGYSRNANGFTHVTIGTANGFTPLGKVKLIDCVVTSYLYGEPCKRHNDDNPGNVSILSNSIFPVPA